MRESDAPQPEAVESTTTEEEEAAEFLQAVEENQEPVSDVIDPDPNDWFSCQLLFRLRHNQPAVVGLFPETNQRVIIFGHDFTKAPGHTLCLSPCTPIFVRMEANRKADGTLHPYEFRALEAQVDGEPVEKVGTAIVTHWREGCWGSGQQPCGCAVFLRREDDEYLDLKSGDKISFKWEFNQPRGKWFGIITSAETAQSDPTEFG